MKRVLAAATVGLALAAPAPAVACPAEALGTARTMTVDPAATPRVGRKQFPETLPLNPKEVVLTFDDGPWPTTTPRVLDALKAECVHATFFLLGRNAAAHPAIVRREAAEGHTIGHHTYSHRLLAHLPLAKAEAEIDRGIATVEAILSGQRNTRPSTPFFRFPGFVANPALLDRMQDRGIAVFGADVWASDWTPMTPDEELHKLMRRIEKSQGGIVLLHDTKAQTARMLPALLRELKKRGFAVVHIVPRHAGPMVN